VRINLGAKGKNNRFDDDWLSIDTSTEIEKKNIYIYIYALQKNQHIEAVLKSSKPPQ
jgi:hypothetical protein